MTEEKLNTLTQKLWMHNASMYLNGNKTKIHSHDNKHWVPDVTTRVKTAKVFTCTLKDCEGLTCKFNGVDI